MKINPLTPSEEQLMQLIWQLNGAYMKDIMLAYPEPKPHQNTVSTFLKILVEKDYLNIEKKGRIFKYLPSLSLETFRKYHLNQFLHTYYNNQINTLIADLNPEGAQSIVVKSIESTDKTEEELEAARFIDDILSVKKDKPKKVKKDKDKPKDKDKKGKSKKKKKN